MFNPKDAGRLLRQDWKNPVDLARELYQMLTTKEGRTVNAPVEIAVPKGQTALRLSQTRPEIATPTGQPPRLRPATAAESQARARPTPPPPDDPGQSRNPAPSPSDFRPPPSSIDHSSAIRIDDRVDEFRAQSAQSPPRSPRPARQQPPRNPPPQVQSGPGGQGSRRDQAAQQARFAKAYQNPLFEVAEGEVKFSGITPVQFDRQPYVFNFDTDQYEPMGKGDGPTPQPAFAEGSQTWGKVASGQGPKHFVTLYDDPDPDTQPGDTVPCTFPALDKDEKIPIGTWVYPVFVNDDGAYFCIIPVWLG